MGSTPAVVAEELGKRYGDLAALRGAGFEVEYGTVFGYLGRNGSGKTTTVRILTTLTEPTTGVARVAGRDVVAEPAEVRRAIGVTMQEAALDPQMTGREHLELMLGLWGRSRAAARSEAGDTLERFGLGSAADRVIATYSGGMQRRLDLAGALVNEPRVLFLDEPTTGLDAQSRRAVWERVRALRDAGTAVFLTTQYLEEADELADRLAVLDAGRIIAEDTPDALKLRHGATRLHVRLADGGAGWQVIETGSVAESLGVLGRLRAEGRVVEEFRLDRPSLEDVFVGLTGAELETARRRR